jgi:hypothetical protein
VKDVPAEKRRFVTEVASDLLNAMRMLGEKITQKEKGEEEEKGGDDDSSSTNTLLDLLFDEGLLPSYAFPTDLCSFVIQDRGEYGKIRDKERPQLAKNQALSEYAPGRLLVVNKETYRVGGIFFNTLPTTIPAEGQFAGVRLRYIGCPRCTYVRLDETSDVEQALQEPNCPVCGEELRASELLDPPGFTPEAGLPVKESDRDQDITYASTAQLPELVDREEFKWKSKEIQLEFARAEGVKLIVANKGRNGDGFAVCEKCGAAWLSDDDVPAKSHRRPFLVPRHVMMREQATAQCSGNIRRGIYLGHQFRTDILLLRVSFKAPMDFSPAQPWLYDALATLSEAIALGASLTLTIDPGELSAGFRLVPPKKDGIGAAEIYLFDTASGGAGYSFDAGENLDDVLDTVQDLLSNCPGECERSCTKCLRHYGNRFFHPRFDRRLGLKLLHYARTGNTPQIAPITEQATCLEPLSRFLALEGWSISTLAKIGQVVAPLIAERPTDGRAVLVGTYPALLSRDAVATRHELRKTSNKVVVLLPDYLVEQDLPSAYQEFLRQQTAP